MNDHSDATPTRHYHYRRQPAPMVLVALFGSLVIALDDRGLHLAVLDPQERAAL